MSVIVSPTLQSIIEMRFWSYLNKYVAITFISMVLLISIFSNFLANDKPILLIEKNGTLSFFAKKEDNAKYSFVINPLISYHDGLDLKNTFLRPFERTETGHYLGTDHLGRDVLAGLIHGGKISIGISVLAMLFAAIIGVVVGSLSGYIGDTRYEISISRAFLSIVLLIVAYYFLFHLNFALVPFLVITVITILGFYLVMKRISWLRKRFIVPLDFLLLKFMETFSSIPTYFLILAFVVFVKPNWLLFAFIIGATSWILVARLIRGEMIKVRNSGFIESARAMGVPELSILIKHALPNAMGPLPFAITFGIAGIIVVESTLSYLGVGLPADTLSWGNFLSGFKNNTSAWWIAVLPGIVIFLTILSLHILGRQLDDRFNPRR